MRLAVVVAALSISAPLAAAGQTGASAARGPRGPRPVTSAPTKVAEAYSQFLLAHRLGQNDDVNGAVAAYKRAMELDPLAADVPAELAALYLRQNQVEEAISAAEVALKVAPANREANRVLGIIFAAMTAPGRDTALPRGGDRAENLAKAIRYLETALDRPAGETEPNVRATLARLYLRAGTFDKAITLLTDLASHEPSWLDGPLLLVQAYAGAGRSRDAIAWLEEKTPDDPRLLPTLADLYERDRRWNDAANAYAKAVQRAPRNTELKTRYGSALVSAGGSENLLKAREVLGGLASARTADPRVLYLLSQAERRTGNVDAAESTARRLINATNGRSPWGYYALAGALEEKREYRTIIEILTPGVATIRGRAGDNSGDLVMLLPHLGFAHEALGEHDKAIAVLEEARRVAPTDPSVAASLAEANIGAKKYEAAVALAQQALGANPGNVRLARLVARALRQNGKPEQGVTLLEDIVKRQPDDPTAYVALAQVYADDARWPQAVKLLQDAELRFPRDISILFELGAVFDKQKRFADAEATFRHVLIREPENAAALNYLGYLLAERGERLDEAAGYLKKALEKDPYNGSYLDSLGWAYFRGDKLDLAEPNLRRAADQLKTNSVIQDHYGDLLFKLGRFDEAIAAWTLALAGDSESIERTDIDKKIRAAKQKLGKK